jgi:hypothetical protein
MQETSHLSRGHHVLGGETGRHSKTKLAKIALFRKMRGLALEGSVQPPFAREAFDLGKVGARVA